MPITEVDRLYIIGLHDRKGQLRKTHLAYWKFFGLYDEALVLFCQPDTSITMVHSPCFPDDGSPMSKEDAEQTDAYFNEVTCKTCLRNARGGVR